MRLRAVGVFLAGPVLELLVGPWVLTGLSTGDGLPEALRVPGALLTAIGVAVVLACFAQLVREGRGTPSPVAPTQELVAGGPYRFVRHPMYAAGALTLAGEALLLSQPILLVAAAAYLATLGTLAVRFEEPLLARRFGPAWAAYAAAVPRWVPRSSSVAASRSPKPPARR